MGKVRWTGWTVALATLLVAAGVQSARADVASDLPAAQLVYPRIVVNSAIPAGYGTDTLIRLTNTSPIPVNLKCFYVNANGHCSKNNKVCGGTSGYTCTTDDGSCTPGWMETDFHINLTSYQPLEWSASEGLSSGPIPYGVCLNNPLFTCGTNAECDYYGIGGFCSAALAGTNAGTRIPPVSEDPYNGSLRCFAVSPETGNPVVRNDLKGEAVVLAGNLVASPDMNSYNAIGIQAKGSFGADLGDGPTYRMGPGDGGEYNACPTVAILNHFFQDAPDTLPAPGVVATRITIVPCSDDYLHQVGGSAVMQYLVFNEFEQRFSTSRTVNCYQEIELCNIDTPTCSRSIFNINVAGTVVGQTRINAIPLTNAPNLPSRMLVLATEKHTNSYGPHTAAFNVHFAGTSDTADTLTIP